MKPLAKRLLALASAAAITLSTIPAVHADEFATEEVNTWSRLAPAAEQLPTQEQAEPTEAPLTRLGAAQLVMEGYRTITDVTDEDLGETELMFLDTENTDVLNAYNLDLVWQFYSELKVYGLTLGDSVPFLIELMQEDAELMRMYLSEMGMLYLFVAIGAFSTIRNAMRKV